MLVATAFVSCGCPGEAGSIRRNGDAAEEAGVGVQGHRP